MTQDQMHPERKVALCYVRLSVTKDDSDFRSPERQRANIQRICDRMGWTAEWYQDTKGHRSATKEENRPEWMKLKARLGDPDVAALVVNDLSRAMRSAWRAIKLFEDLPVGVVLYLARLDRQIDITSPDGRMNAFLQAFLDDIYAQDAAKRSQDSVKHRKLRGISIGLPPFGTVRDTKTGRLTPSTEGAWLMPDGTYLPGEDADSPPHPDAQWRGYYDCARKVLELYALNLHGYKRIALTLDQDGWTFRTRNGEPRPLNGDDVRRIIANWREYAGLVSMGRAREKSTYQLEDIADVLDGVPPDQAVFDLELLRAVANAQEARSILTRPKGASLQAYPFPLANILFCATCDKAAQQHDDPGLRSRYIGWNKNDMLRYRHSASRNCDRNSNSILAEIVEAEFIDLVHLLTIRPEAVALMSDIAVQSQYEGYSDANEEKQLAMKREAIAKHRRALSNLKVLFGEGEITEEEYFKKREYNRRELARWEAMTTDRQKVATQIMVTMEALSRIVDHWEISGPEDRQLLARTLFDEIVYDIDAQQITDFKVKSWAEPFIVLRAALDVEQQQNEESKNHPQAGGFSSDGHFHDPNGTRTRVFTLKG